MSFSNNVHISDAHFWSMLCFFIICVLVDGFNFIRALGTVVKVVLSVPKKIISVNLTVIIITTLFLQIYMWLNSVFASSSFCVPEPVFFLTSTLMVLFSILISLLWFICSLFFNNQNPSTIISLFSPKQPQLQYRHSRLQKRE